MINMHQEVRDFILKTKKKYPKYFKNRNVLEFGSLDFNGTPREYFINCKYIGIDRTRGAGVDIQCNAHEYKGKKVDVVITTEMLEHDKYAEQSIINGYKHLRQGGIFIGTAANINRKKHYEFVGEDEHYKNISKDFIEKIAKKLKAKYYIEEDDKKLDIRFILWK